MDEAVRSTLASGESLYTLDIATLQVGEPGNYMFARGLPVAWGVWVPWLCITAHEARCVVITCRILMCA